MVGQFYFNVTNHSMFWPGKLYTSMLFTAGSIFIFLGSQQNAWTQWKLPLLHTDLQRYSRKSDAEDYETPHAQKTPASSVDLMQSLSKSSEDDIVDVETKRRKEKKVCAYVKV